MKVVSIINCGIGNVQSLINMIEYLGYHVKLISSADDFSDKHPVIFPGAGNFDAVCYKLKQIGLWNILGENIHQNDEFQYLGICVGAQILLLGSEEGKELGLGFLPSNCTSFARNTDLKLSVNMGWHKIEFEPEFSCFADMSESNMFYFVHSYYMPRSNLYTIASSEVNGLQFSAIVGKKNKIGCQFHPEKSSVSGMSFLTRFIKTSQL